MKQDIASGQDIRQLVDSFYDRICDDDLLGGIFTHARKEWGIRIENPAHQVKRPSAPSGARGQSLVEFSIVLAPLLLVLLGVLQFGLIFNSYVTVSNAVREAAREGSIYRYSQAVCNGGGGGGGNGGGNQSCRDANDAARMARMLTVFRSSLGMLSTAAPQFTDADLTVTYEIPSGAVDADTRAGDRLVLRATYHQDLLVPFIAAFLPQETISGRTTTPIRAQVTMVVN